MSCCTPPRSRVPARKACRSSRCTARIALACLGGKGATIDGAWFELFSFPPGRRERLGIGAAGSPGRPSSSCAPLRCCLYARDRAAKPANHCRSSSERAKLSLRCLHRNGLCSSGSWYTVPHTGQRRPVYPRWMSFHETLLRALPPVDAAPLAPLSSLPLRLLRRWIRGRSSDVSLTADPRCGGDAEEEIVITSRVGLDVPWSLSRAVNNSWSLLRAIDNSWSLAGKFPAAEVRDEDTLLRGEC